VQMTGRKGDINAFQTLSFNVTHLANCVSTKQR